MTQEKGIPYQRHKPSAALREFLDPLDPGSYFDCGRARLHGLDDALLKEAESRGRRVGDDSFQLVATDMGLIFCRPSISFAIAARWEEAMLIRPHGDDPVVLPVTWPTHGELKFTVSKRLAGNIFRRWLQLRMQAARLARNETSERAADEAASTKPDVPGAPVGSAGAGGSSPANVAKRSGSSDRLEETVLAEDMELEEDTYLPADSESPENTQALEGTASPEEVGVRLPEPSADVGVPTSREEALSDVAAAAEFVAGDETPSDGEADAEEPEAAEVSADSQRTTDPESAAEPEPPVEIDSGSDIGSGSDVGSDRTVAIDRTEVGLDEVVADEWEVVVKVDSPAEPEPEFGSSVVERRDTGVSAKRRKLDERGAAKRRIDRQPLLAVFDAETTLPIGASESDPETVAGERAAPAQERVVDEPIVAEGAVVGPETVAVDGPGEPKPEPGPTSVPEREAELAAESESVSELDEYAWPDHRSHRKDAAVAKTETKSDESGPAPDRATVLAQAAGDPIDLTDGAARPVATDDGARRAARLRLDADPSPGPGDGADVDGAKVRSGASSSADRIGEFDGAAIRTIAKPETAEPSWVGSPLSLVATAVAISSFVLVITLAASVFRDGNGGSIESAGPAGPVARTTIDHQRFKPGNDSSVPLRSAALTPTGSSIVGSTTSGASSTGADATSAKDERIGNNEPRLCNSNYSGCVADVSDVDCPGDGDGPVFSESPAIVMGEDVYLLDTDGDGETCEADQPRLEDSALREASDGERGDGDAEAEDQESTTADLNSESP